MSDHGSNPTDPQQPGPQQEAAVQQAGAARNLDAHRDRYAQRTAGMTASEIRALFAVASRPEVVSLAGGMPNLAALDRKSVV